MRIIVLSDTHGDTKIIEKILKNNKYDYSVIAGDFQCDDFFIKKYFDFAVKGNNDWNSDLPDQINFEIDGVRFFLEHGHLTGSYFQLDNYEFMKKQLNSRNVDIYIHGHTHVCKIFEYENGIVLNPGSTTFPRGGTNKSFAIIEIDDNKNINCQIVNID